MLNFSDFSLTRAVLEVRYANAYILWDRAGKIWADISSLWPDVKVMTVQPSTTAFRLEDKYDLSVQFDKAHIIDLKPTSSLDDFMERADRFMKLVIQHLEIKHFTRTGFRLIYVKPFPDKFQAADSLISTGMISVPHGRQFNIEGRVLLPKYSLVLESDSAGVRILMEVVDKKIDFDPDPSINGLKPVHLETHELAYDVDYYIPAKLSIGQLNVKEWLSQAYHLIKRDSKSFLGAI